MPTYNFLDLAHAKIVSNAHALDLCSAKYCYGYTVYMAMIHSIQYVMENLAQLSIHHIPILATNDFRSYS